MRISTPGCISLYVFKIVPMRCAPPTAHSLLVALQWSYQRGAEQSMAFPLVVSEELIDCRLIRERIVRALA